MSSIEQRVREYIEREKLLCDKGLHLVALSGGADSVCLLLMMQRLGYRVEAMHCNFHLRGDESDRDEAFVKNLCQTRNVELHLAHFDTRAYAALHKMSIEMAARDLRYGYFLQLMLDLGAADICVAHHQDDNVETVLMNLLRGTGLRGLKGIQPRHDDIVRPLLCLSRAEIEQWLEEQGQPFVTDSTNLVADVVRNKLRLDIIPRLKDIFPQATTNILTTARHVGEAMRVYDDTIANRLCHLLRQGDGGIEIDELMNESSAESILYEWLTPVGFSSATIEQISSMLPHLQSGREWTSTTHTVVSHDHRLLLSAIEPERRTMRIPETGTYVYDDTTKFRLVTFEGQHIERDPNVCCVDASTVTFPLEIRPLCNGDRFHPLGMKGTKLVSDFLTDQHFSLIDKRRQLALCNADGSIVWLVGLRMDDRYKVTDKTISTLTITIEQQNTQI